MTNMNVLSAADDIINVSAVEEIEVLRPESRTIVLWVFRDLDDRWCARQEGGHTETFANREKAVSFARQTGQIWGSYRLFLERMDGRVAQELFNLGCR
jgi:hypothetical protein